MRGVSYALSLVVAIGGVIAHSSRPLDLRAASGVPGSALAMNSGTCSVCGVLNRQVDPTRATLVERRLPRLRVRHYASEGESDPTEDLRDAQCESLACTLHLTTFRNLALALDPLASASGRPSFLSLCRFLC